MKMTWITSASDTRYGEQFFQNAKSQRCLTTTVGIYREGKKTLEMCEEKKAFLVDGDVQNLSKK